MQHLFILFLWFTIILLPSYLLDTKLIYAKASPLAQWTENESALPLGGPERGESPVPANGVRSALETAQDLDAREAEYSRKLARSLGLPEDLVLENPYRVEAEHKAREIKRQTLLEKWAEEDKHKSPARDSVTKKFILKIIFIFMAIMAFGFIFKRAIKRLQKNIAIGKYKKTKLQRIGILLCSSSFLVILFCLYRQNYIDNDFDELLNIGTLFFILGFLMIIEIPQKIYNWITLGE